jgi:hypothetical protein
MISKIKKYETENLYLDLKRSNRPNSNAEPVTRKFSDWATLTCKVEIYETIYRERRADFNEGKDRTLVVAENELTSARWLQDDREGIRTGRRKSYESIKMDKLWY